LDEKTPFLQVFNPKLDFLSSKTHDGTGEKRWRATAVQDAGAFMVTTGWREASWSAPDLWRFGWHGERAQLVAACKGYAAPTGLGNGVARVATKISLRTERRSAAKASVT